MIVIDASATIALLLNEDNKFVDLDALSGLADETLAAPSHWTAEVGNALVNNVRRRRLERIEIPWFIQRLERLGIEVAPAPSLAETALIADQAVELGLTFYDAAYVHMALTGQASLFTLDGKMRDVAAGVSIPILPR